MLLSCGGGSAKQETVTEEVPVTMEVKELNAESPDCDQYVLMSTSMGDITIKLYRDAPLHRKNFINLVMNGYYDGQVFYRVKGGTLIQAGDYLSAVKPDDPMVGKNDEQPKVASEIDPSKRYHKTGALAAASVNRGEFSSGAHFYIVAGGKVNDEKLDEGERLVHNAQVDHKYIELQLENNDEIRRLKEAGLKKELGQFAGKLKREAEKSFKGKKFAYGKQQRAHYKNVGGAPELDPHYTVFGEVLEGLDVVKAISWVDANPNGLPRQHVKINKITVLNDYSE